MPTIDEKFKPSPDAFMTAEQQRAWLDFITWYHQAIIDFAEQSIQTMLKYFPKEKVRIKPGGNAGGVNPIAWGTYCPGYAKMAAKYGIVLQPADWHGGVLRRQVGRHRLPVLRRPARHRAGRRARSQRVRPADVLRRLLRRAAALHLRVRAARRRHPQVRPPRHRQARRDARSPSSARPRSIASAATSSRRSSAPASSATSPISTCSTSCSSSTVR